MRSEKYGRERNKSGRHKISSDIVNKQYFYDLDILYDVFAQW